MNKKGQYIFYGIAMAILLLVTIIAFIEPLKENIRIARNDTHMNCTDPNLSTGEKATCIMIDWWLFGFVGVAGGVAFSYLTYKKIKQ